MNLRKTAVLLIATLSLAACGSTPGERGLTGAGIGAATGAVIGLASGGIGVLAGAVIGAAAGGSIGAFSSPDHINLGKPFWRWGRQRARVARIQTGLRRMGYYRGRADGLSGPQTARAIRRYQRIYRLPVTGQPSYRLYRHMRAHGATG
ncbi:MAG TPA: peptidoglycan-binding domain-containing protein [Alphaproteobacteria bacterium]|nr:peptidoglycan-binding domain-containing protein [Alphaproteobacteria bacterium]